MTWFLTAIADQRRNEDIVDGIKKLVVAYYDEYSDATSIDVDTLGTFRAIETLCTELSIDFELVEVVTEAEAEVLRDTGRRVVTFTDDDDVPR